MNYVLLGLHINVNVKGMFTNAETTRTIEYRDFKFLVCANHQSILTKKWVLFRISNLMRVGVPNLQRMKMDGSIV